MCKIRSEDRIPAEKLMIRLKLNRLRECIQNKRLSWFGHLERMKELGQVNLKPSSFKDMAVSLEQNHGKHTVRCYVSLFNNCHTL